MKSFSERVNEDGSKALSAGLFFVLNEMICFPALMAIFESEADFIRMLTDLSGTIEPLAAGGPLDQAAKSYRTSVQVAFLSHRQTS